MDTILLSLGVDNIDFNYFLIAVLLYFKVAFVMILNLLLLIFLFDMYHANDLNSTSVLMTRSLISIDFDEKSEFSVKLAKLNSLFDSTVRSCLGIKCFDEKPISSPCDRIGLLGTKLSGVDEINLVLKDLLGAYYIDTISDSTTTSDPKIIQSMHVPAYGYGKNHGWSRIIRIVRRPIDQAIDIVNSLIPKSIDEQSNRYVDAQVRQLVRWQCRLSHVAAHTKLLTSKFIYIYIVCICILYV